MGCIAAAPVKNTIMLALEEVKKVLVPADKVLVPAGKVLVPADKVLVPTDMRQELGTLYARYKYWYKVQNSCPLAARDYQGLGFR
jgi:hypothetical protein